MRAPRLLPLLVACGLAATAAGCGAVSDRVAQAERDVDRVQRDVGSAADRARDAGQAVGEIAGGDLGAVVGRLSDARVRDVERLVGRADVRGVSCPPDGSTRDGGSLRIRCTATRPDGERVTLPVTVSPDGGVTVDR